MSSSLQPTFADATAAMPNIHRVLSPDEFHQAQAMTPQALAQADFPATPPLDYTVKPDASRVGGPPAADIEQNSLFTLDQSNVFVRALNGLQQMAENPVESAVGMATAPVKGAITASQYVDQEIRKHLSPEAYAKVDQVARFLTVPGLADALQPLQHPSHEISGTEAALGAAQAAAPVVAGPVTGLLTKGTGTLIGPALGILAAHTAVGAGLGAAYSPDDPAAGALIGGTLGLATGIPAAKAAHVDALLQPVRDKVAAMDDALRAALAPDTRSEGAAQAADIIRGKAAAMRLKTAQVYAEMDTFRRDVDALPVADQLGFIDTYEGGGTQPSEPLANLAATMKRIWDGRIEDVRATGTGKLQTLIENYFTHRWTNPEAAAEWYRAQAEGVGAETPGTPIDGAATSEAATSGTEALKAAQASMGGRRPLEGSKSFLKQRSIPTTKEGMAMGLEPVSTNPIDLFLLSIREMDKYVLGHEIVNGVKGEPAIGIQYVPSGEMPPEGLQPINDKVFTVFGPREGAVALPEGANIAPDQVGVPGMRIMGRYYAPEPVARVFNNYLSPGFRGNPIYDAYRGLGNALNRAQLGLSAFHLTASSVNVYASRLALGLEKVTQGRIREGVKDIFTAPAAPYQSWKLGKDMQRVALHPELAHGDIPDLVQVAVDAGANFTVDPFYANSARADMTQAWKQGEYGKAAGYSIPAFLDWQSKWLMENVVPRQKLGVFGEMARNIMDQLPDDTTPTERTAALAKAWDAVDNRMGQMVYDNLFWNKAFKDLAMASVRSVGWNLGTVRELGGGTVDIVKGLKNLTTGQKAELTHRAAFVAALPIGIGILGAAYQYLRTGEGPQELKDYFFPKTGEVDADSNPERVQIASYMKDMFAYSGSPWQTAKHKLSPALSAVYEMFQNQDYYGDQIRNPNDPFVQQVMQEAKWVGTQAIPFSLQGISEAHQRSDTSIPTVLGNWFGITPAPRSRVRTAAQNKMMDYLSERTTGATPEDAAARQSRNDILASLRGNQNIDLGKAVADAIGNSQLTPKALGQLLKRAGTTPAQERFKRLTVPEALDVFQSATPEEQALFAKLLLKKLDRLASQ